MLNVLLKYKLGINNYIKSNFNTIMKPYRKYYGRLVNGLGI